MTFDGAPPVDADDEWPTGDEIVDLTIPDSFDDANVAEALADQLRGRWLYIASWGRWLRWDGTRWATWRQQKDKTTTDWKAAARSAALGLGVPLDELAAPHTTTSPGPRVLRVDGGIKHITKENAS